MYSNINKYATITLLVFLVVFFGDQLLYRFRALNDGEKTVKTEVVKVNGCDSPHSVKVRLANADEHLRRFEYIDYQVYFDTYAKALKYQNDLDTLLGGSVYLETYIIVQPVR